jgi:hypothetical protein
MFPKLCRNFAKYSLKPARKRVSPFQIGRKRRTSSFLIQMLPSEAADTGQVMATEVKKEGPASGDPG